MVASCGKSASEYLPTFFLLLLLSNLDNDIPKNDLRKCTSYGIKQYVVRLVVPEVSKVPPCF
jgi:hypothetical protein